MYNYQKDYWDGGESEADYDRYAKAADRDAATEICPECDGTGKVSGKTCKTCLGSGKLTPEQMFDLYGSGG